MRGSKMSLAMLKKTLDSFWTGELGFSIKNLQKGEVKIVRIKQMVNIPPHWPLIALKVDGRCIIPLEDRRVSDVEKSLENLFAEEVFTTRGIETIQRLLGFSQDRIAHWLHLFCDKKHFKPYRKHRARRLTEADEQICKDWHLKHPKAIGPHSYQYANPIPDGIIVDGELMSVALVLRYNLPFWEIGVETRPDCRGRGYAKSVTSLATEEAIAFGKMAWCYLDVNSTNIVSLRVAKSLGYVEYMETLNRKPQQNP
jgi:RimJ/RimL family protein N-acetyltransferase